MIIRIFNLAQLDHLFKAFSENPEYVENALKANVKVLFKLKEINSDTPMPFLSVNNVSLIFDNGNEATLQYVPEKSMFLFNRCDEQGALSVPVMATVQPYVNDVEELEMSYKTMLTIAGHSNVEEFTSEDVDQVEGLHKELSDVFNPPFTIRFK